MSTRPSSMLTTLLILAILTACSSVPSGPGPDPGAGPGPGPKPDPDPDPDPDPRPDPQENRPPIVSVVEAHDVTAGQSLTLVATGTDPDGDPISYAWKQVSGPPVGTLEGATPSFEVPDDIVTLRFEVAASDGKVATAPAGIIVRVFEDHTRAVFVAATGSDDNAGTRAAPFRTIQKAIDAAFALGGGVYVGAGSYTGSVAMRDRVSLYGGFDPAWIRDPVAHPTRIDGGPVAVVIDSVGFLSIDGFQIRSADATAAISSSVGVRVSHARSVILARNLIEAGAGAPGTAAVQPAQTATGANGKPGMAGGGCATTRVGGAGGTSTIGSAGGRGGNGGLGGGFAGAKGTGPGAGAAGAAAGAFAPGKSGGNAVVRGPSGANGGSGNELGLLLGWDYRPSPGNAGQPGIRGGGGGGGSGGAGNLIGFCGGGGGGGGAGGAGGLGGPGGNGGGGSFGVIVALESTGIIIRDNIVRAGEGAPGGAGACGGAGGAGGKGGAGGQGANLLSYRGGVGGAGGDGGFGGNGGGGGGGPSIGILESPTSEIMLERNSIAAGAGGPGGAGKGSGCVGGNPGFSGRSEPYLKLDP